MKSSATHAASTLLQTMHFTGLSGEQALLATLVSQNPATHPQIRRRARSLLLLNEGATVAEAARELGGSPRAVAAVVRRFVQGGFCQAVLGSHASRESRVWLTLSPSSRPRVRLQPAASAVKRAIDTEAASATCTPDHKAGPLSPRRQTCRLKKDLRTHPPHAGGPARPVSHV